MFDRADIVRDVRFADYTYKWNVTTEWIAALNNIF